MSCLQKALSEIYDVAVIGGGINGAGIAADAAGRGLSVFLCEQDDLAQHTSSASSKLIHGGLRYLENAHFRMVRESLAEREILLAKAPHLIKPLRFVLPHQPTLRPAWLIRTGLFLYDHLGKRKRLSPSRSIEFDADSPLQPHFKRGFEYSDCSVDDARLVIANAIAAHERGAHIATRTRCHRAVRHNGFWRLQILLPDGSVQFVQARALINAAGPWVVDVIEGVLRQKTPYNIRLVQGSHIVVPRLYEGEHAYILQNEDRRIIFVIPYLEHFSLVGTTDLEYRGDPTQVQMTAAERDYLLESVNRYFKTRLEKHAILHSYAGLRPLYDDASDNPANITRDYTLNLLAPPGEPPLLSVFGGKVTTYRKLSESAVDCLVPFFPKMGSRWTAKVPLPGGEAPRIANLEMRLCERYTWLRPKVSSRWVNQFGNRVWHLLEQIHCPNDLGEHLGNGLYTAEVDYLCRYEWAKTAEDILWRRTKLGLFLSPAEQLRLAEYLAEKHASPEPHCF